MGDILGLSGVELENIWSMSRRCFGECVYHQQLLDGMSLSSSANKQHFGFLASLKMFTHFCPLLNDKITPNMATCREIFLTQAVSLTTFSQLFYASPKYFLEFPKHFSLWSIFSESGAFQLPQFLIWPEKMLDILSSLLNKWSVSYDDVIILKCG